MSTTISRLDRMAKVLISLKVALVLAFLLALFGDAGIRASTASLDAVAARNEATAESENPWTVLGTSDASDGRAAQAVIIDHSSTDITAVPQVWIEAAKSELHIAYGHSSHGSQLTTGMAALVGFANNGGLGLALPQDIFAYNSGGTGGALDLREPFPGDVGYYPQWVNETRAYLGPPNPATGRGTINPEINVVIWAWCGQVSAYNEEQMLEKYLLPMTQLEEEYPGIVFVYMTGHADGTGEEGNLHLRNQQIRDYCVANGKVLYDFYDIELYDPDGSYYGDKAVTDNCDYDSTGDGTTDRNWAIDWQTLHVEDTDWYACVCEHSQALNCNRKAYAAWALWARIAGWGAEPLAGPQKTASPQGADYGDAVTYTILIQDLDLPDTATLYLTDVVPEGLAYVPGTLAATSGTANDIDAPTLRWSGTLASSPTITVTYNATVDTNASEAITNNAVITSPGYEPVTITVTILANPQRRYVPVILGDG